MKHKTKTAVDISLERGSGLLEREQNHIHSKTPRSKRMTSAFLSRNKSGTTRVFVAGGSRSGNRKIYEMEAFRLGQEIGRRQYRLDFGLASGGIMGAVARGVLDAWIRQDRTRKEAPIHGITTKEYLALYQSDDLINAFSDIIVAHTLEERKQQLLNADFVIFAPGGVGTLDELAYDCVAMQDGFLNFKPFVLYNVDGYFHHLVEYLKDMHLKGFADQLPFIVVDNSFEAGLAFDMIGRYYQPTIDKSECRTVIENLIHDLPYVIAEKSVRTSTSVQTILDEKDAILTTGTARQKKELKSRIENAYLNKEIERMYDRLAKSGQDTATVSYKLSSLKRRSTKRPRIKKEK